MHTNHLIYELLPGNWQLLFFLARAAHITHNLASEKLQTKHMETKDHINTNTILRQITKQVT